ncbi:Uncharacterized conserved protein [Plasmopara halstedii]|uniref:Uncharacterized conserved protein n=1 Tax=Plasmopara halstedii TaxID=4781 RepID=A0A0P1AP13_PLAHL|nr:Uncharacterized conserved protein [Plasmopara halstedii]CEG42479.1 Uncharacterized conserved protein [Plasmopara halstedii]|eukprot:XP_024578848.1 Uncharacterized conserved protein [Plasmopara halstedii]
MEDNAELQSEEIEVLRSIFEDAFCLKADLDNSGLVRSFTISLGGPHAIVLLVHLPQGYPSIDAPIAEVYESFGLTNIQRDEILECLTAIFERSKGQVCLYEWIGKVRDRYSSAELESSQAVASNTNNNGKGLAVEIRLQQFDSDPRLLRPRVRTAQLIRNVEREVVIAPLIVHGKMIIDRKSTFIAHACRVKSVQDVRAFLALLLDDRKVEQATHNILAYRIVGATTIKDNDEDGEHGAGSKLLFLLELLKAENVAVVVTRWYGGIKLGPDRFKHINSCARQALEDSGLIHAQNDFRKKGKR